ncbi:MAG: hypothetical protein SFU85_12035 [Candidatus Methylacidiphilales bacterium]|nr:hypothetical protein [Candidatus Methylacidiphilales bacterium]
MAPGSGKLPLPASSLKSSPDDVKAKTSVINMPAPAGAPKVSGLPGAPGVGAPRPQAPMATPAANRPAPQMAAAAPNQASAPAPAPRAMAPAPLAASSEGFPALALVAMLIAMISAVVTLLGFLDIL